MNIEFKSHEDEVLQQLTRAAENALEECGLLGEDMPKICPVDTGRLRNSIAHTVRESEQAAYIGTNVSYAPHVELGTRRQRAQPYLKPAVSEHSAQYKKLSKKP